jgi:hypothetical protein
MPDYIFGKTITRTFNPVEDGVYINLVSQAPSIYLYSASNQPTLQNMINGVGAFDHITYWQESGVSPYTRTYTVSAIPDPDSGNTAQPSLGYWEVVNYIAKVGGATQSKARYFEVERALALDSTPGTTIQALKDAYPAISAYFDDPELEAQLLDAEEYVRLELEGKGFEWGKIKGLKKARLPLAYKTLQFACEAQISNDGDKFTINRQLFLDRYNALMKVIKFDYDSDADGQPDSSVTDSADFIIAAK